MPDLRENQPIRTRTPRLEGTVQATPGRYVLELNAVDPAGRSKKVATVAIEVTRRG